MVLLGEEFDEIQILDSEFIWVIDPIDGTQKFYCRP